MAGQGVAISHGISCTVRHHSHFERRDSAKFIGSSEVHRLFALPGPGIKELKLDTGARAGSAGSDSEDLGEPMFRILLDVTQFKPEDILIQVFEGWLLVKGQHAAQMDEHGFVARSFTRQYQLPDDQLHVEDLTAMLCHDGILVVESKERWWSAAD